MTNPSPRFTGIFIPAEILEMEELTFFEMLLLSWIDALYCPEHGGCYASNQYLGQKLKGAQENTVAKAICNLRRLGLIEDVSYDGRKRIIRALISNHVNKHQSKSELDKNPMGVGQKSNSEMDKNPSTPPLPIIIERKEEDKREIAPSQADAKIARFFNVHTTQQEHEKLIKKYGQKLVEQAYENLSEWKKSAKPSQVNKHSSDFYRMNKWVCPDIQNQNPKAYGAYKRSGKLVIEADTTRLEELKAKGSGFFEENDVEKALAERLRTKGY